MALAWLGPLVLQPGRPGRLLDDLGRSLARRAAAFGLISQAPAPMVGASGALFGLAGAWLAWEAEDRLAEGIPLRRDRAAGRRGGAGLRASEPGHLGVAERPVGLADPSRRRAGRRGAGALVQAARVSAPCRPMRACVPEPDLDRPAAGGGRIRSGEESPRTVRIRARAGRAAVPAPRRCAKTAPRRPASRAAPGRCWRWARRCR